MEQKGSDLLLSIENLIGISHVHRISAI